MQAHQNAKPDAMRLADLQGYSESLQLFIVKSGFFLDAFSANCVFDFAETLSFCLEF